MAKYKCTRSFCVERVVGEPLGEPVLIEEGSLWNRAEDDYRIIGGEVRLEADSGEWLEIPYSTLESDFEEITEE